MAYIGKSPDGTGVRSRFYYTQTSGGGTSVSGSSDDGTTLAFSDGAYVDVFLNGVLLVAGTDYNTSTANTIAGLAALANGDVVEVVVYDIFTVADTVSALNGGTFQSNVVFNGTADVNGNELILDADGDTSITADTDDQIDFKTGGTDAMHIDGTGRVQIGTSTAKNDALLTIRDSGTANPMARIAFDSGDAGVTNGVNVGYTAATFAPDFEIANKDNGIVRFKTNDSERMRIDAGGKIKVSTTGDAGATVTIKHTGAGDGLGIWNANGTSGYFGQIRFRNNANSGDVGSIVRTNDASVSYNTTSDHRVKENVADMTGAIARVKQLAPKRFNFIADTTDTLVDGFLAHEAQTVVPEAVTGTHNEVDDDGNAVMQGIDQSKLVPLLTGALREAITKIETLETKVAALEAGE